MRDGRMRRKWNVEGEFVEVFSTGQIKVNGNERRPIDYLYDPDMDLFSGLSNLEVNIDKKKNSNRRTNGSGRLCPG